MLVSKAVSKFKKKVETKKEAVKRQLALRNELFEKVLKSPEFKEATKTARLQLAEKWESMRDASTYEKDLWIAMQTQSVMEKGMGELWKHVAEEKDELTQLRETHEKMKEQFVILQTRALQEVTALKERCRTLPKDMEMAIDSVEFYNALEFVEPNMRYLTESIIKEELKKLVVRGGGKIDSGSEVQGLKREITELKKALDGKDDVLKNAEAAGGTMKQRLLDLEAEVDAAKHQIRDLQERANKTPPSSASSKMQEPTEIVCFESLYY